jgi:hypothetical protein
MTPHSNSTLMPPSHLDPRPPQCHSGNRTRLVIRGCCPCVRCSYVHPCVRSTWCRLSFALMPLGRWLRTGERNSAVSLGLRSERFDAFVDSFKEPSAETGPELGIRTSPTRPMGWGCLCSYLEPSPAFIGLLKPKLDGCGFNPTPNALTGVNKGNTTSQPRVASEAISHLASHREIRPRNSAPPMN